MPSKTNGQMQKTERPQGGFSLIELLIVVAIILIMAAIAIPNFVEARTTSQENACINNLRMIDSAKAQWALEKSKKDADQPTAEDLKAYLNHDQFPHCPAGGEYTIGTVGEKPKCSISGHELP